MVLGRVGDPVAVQGCEERRSAALFTVIEVVSGRVAMAPRQKGQRVKSGRFDGVWDQNGIGRWNGYVSHQSKNIWTSSYDTEEEAAHARDK